MRFLEEANGDEWESGLVGAVAGAAAGLVVGVLVSRVLWRNLPRTERIEATPPKAAPAPPRRLRPARLHRLAAEQEELDNLEDSVLHRFRSDPLLSERAIDIGAISPGIVEVTGSVATEAESDQATALASGVAGVRTVVNRLEVDMAARRGGLRRRSGSEDGMASFANPEGRVGSMGRRRQSTSTEPDQRDDAQALRWEALAKADREQFEDECYVGIDGVEVAAEQAAGFREDELDNQDPHGKHARVTLDAQPQHLNSDARVGEGLKPGVARSLRVNDAEYNQQGGDDGTER